MSIHRFSVVFVAIAFLAGCANKAKNTEPDDMSVEEHQAAADEHEERAERHEEQYDPDAESQRQVATAATRPNAGGSTYRLETYNPTSRHEELAERHQEHVEQHEAAAQALLDYEEKHCARFPKKTRATCPLMGQVAGATEVKNGVRMSFHEDVNFEATSDHVQCHYAFARTEGYEGMETCPLYVNGIEVAENADARTITITAESKEAVEKIRERASAHVTAN